MFTQKDIDAALNDAQQAVDALASDVGTLEAAPAGPQAAGRAVAATAARPGAQSADDAIENAKRTPALRRLLALRVPVIVRLAQRPISVHDIINMGPGTILEFDRTVDQELDLMIANCVIGTGIAVKVGEHFGLRVTRIGNVRDRIRSLGGA